MRQEMAQKERSRGAEDDAEAEAPAALENEELAVATKTTLATIDEVLPEEDVTRRFPMDGATPAEDRDGRILPAYHLYQTGELTYAEYLKVEDAWRRRWPGWAFSCGGPVYTGS